jgi:hypothetical protein
MANEITVTAVLSFVEGGRDASMSKSTQHDFVAAVGSRPYIKSTQNIGTSEESVAKGDITNIGWCAIKNLDSTYYVEIGCVTGQYTIKLKAGESCVFRAAANTIFAKANTSAVDIEYLFIED